MKRLPRARLALAVSLVLAPFLVGSPDAAAAGCAATGQAYTAAGLYSPSPARNTTLQAVFVQHPMVCTFAGTINNATCTGGTLADGTPVVLQPMNPAECQYPGPGEHEFIITMAHT